MPITDLPKTHLAITHTLSGNASPNMVIDKINEIIGKINFLDEHINFLYDRSRTQYNTLVDQGVGLQNVYDEFQDFKKRFVDWESKKSKQKSLGASLDLLDRKPNN